jgi:hypothetical protein
MPKKKDVGGAQNGDRKAKGMRVRKKRRSVGEEQQPARQGERER